MKKVTRGSTNLPKTSTYGKYSIYDTGSGYLVYLSGRVVSPELASYDEAVEFIENQDNRSVKCSMTPDEVEHAILEGKPFDMDSFKQYRGTISDREAELLGAIKADQVQIGDTIEIDFDASEANVGELVNVKRVYKPDAEWSQYCDIVLDVTEVNSGKNYSLHYDNNDLVGYLVDEDEPAGSNSVTNGLPEYLDNFLEDFAQTYGQITYADIIKFSQAADDEDIANLSKICRELEDIMMDYADLDLYEAAFEDPEIDDLCQDIVHIIIEASIESATSIPGRFGADMCTM